MQEKNKRMTVAKQKAIERRKALISTYYSAWHVGTEMTIAIDKAKQELSKYALVGKNELNGEYYFLLLSRYNRLYLTKVITSYNRATLVKIMKTSEEYIANKEVFDSWIKKAREDIAEEKKEFEEEYKKHEPIAVRNFVYKEDGVTLYKFMAKHKFEGEYYFVVRTYENEYKVVKVCYYLFAKLVQLNDKESERNKERFDKWIREAKRKPSKKKK